MAMKEIGFGGLDLRGGDGGGVDGMLGYMSNVIVEDGGLKIGVLGATEVVFPDGVFVLAMHDVGEGRNYIVSDGHDVGWVSGGVGDVVGMDVITWFGYGGGGVRVLGNVLTFYGGDVVAYAIWRVDHYDWLGQLPETPELVFDLRLDHDIEQSGWNGGRVFRLDSVGLAGLDEAEQERRRLSHREAHRRLISHANGMIGRHRDKFCFPFFVRYAYRLYDGTLTKHSAPVLMLPSERLNPMFLRDPGIYENGDHEVALDGLRCCLVYGELVMKCRGVDGHLKDWRELITGVEVYVSSPIYSYLQDPSNEDMDNCWRQFPFYSLTNTGGDGIKFSFGVRTGYHHGLKMKGDHGLAELWEKGWGRHCTNGGEWDIKSAFGVPNNLYLQCFGCVPKGDKEFERELEGCGQFYHYASYDLGELLGLAGGGPVVVKSDLTDMRVLAARRVMEDDSVSHLGVQGRSGFVYNSRLHLADLRKHVFGGFGLQCSVQHYEAGVSDKGCWMYIRRRKNGKEIVSRRRMKLSYPTSGMFDGRKQRPLSYVFVPDMDAFELIVAEGEKRVVRLPLKRHGVLNGAYWFGGFRDIDLQPTLPVVVKETEGWYDQRNQLYLSEVGNPFVFPASHAVTVDDNRIIGLASATVALSEGQFGQFPLYAFTDGGIWSLSVGDDGRYRSRQPVSRDICLGDGGSVTQLDHAVVFATDRGVMMLEGSQVVCLSEALDGRSVVDVTGLPKFDLIGDAFRYRNGVGGRLLPWREFLTGAKVAYDYVYDRLYVFNGGVDYVYVLDMGDRVWGVTDGMGYCHVVPSYPDAYVMGGSRLINLSRPVRGAEGCGLVITRPLSLGDGSLLKVMRRLEVRGRLRRGVGKLLLWGSRDGFNWHYLGSSGNGVMRWLGGSGYRLFMVGVGLEGMMGDECLRGVGVEVGM